MSEIVNSNLNIRANVQDVYAETSEFFKEFERTRDLMDSPLPELLTSGKFDSMLKISMGQHQDMLKHLSRDKHFKGSKKEKTLKKYKNALEFANKFISTKSSAKRKALEEFDGVAQRLTMAVDTNWSQTNFNNTLNYFTEISYAFLNIETKYKMGEINQYDAYQSLKQIKSKLDTLPIEDERLSYPYQKLCIFATNYTNAFAKPMNKKSEEKIDTNIKPTFCKYTLDWMNENVQSLHDLVGDIRKIGDQKAKQDILLKKDTKNLYDNMHDTFYYIDKGDVDDKELDNRVTKFETLSRNLEEKRVKDSSETSSIQKISNSMKNVTNTFIEKSAKSTYEETAHRIKNDKNLLEQINSLVKNGYPYLYAEMFFEYLQEKNSCEVTNIRDIEQFCKQPMSPELERELSSYNAKIAQNGLNKPLIKELKPEPLKELDKKPVDNNGNPTFN